ncbi:uncharacterized protein LOC131293343 [Anopheles ziemanni]|uniref:uncharacterized protein LOC131267622 n=1 Tax=Anopheles coustani TaxID=139045 RepID=UPI0026582E48|nr:uncharacterized protein LOC131267622 [Anopheles coustani]XP_058177406.1 uncharacterized protein LOC131293343 [Anopheles ziemanni]
MLKPIKTFLTYLQRNANSSNIFGLTPTTSTTTMGPTEQPRLEEPMMIANEDLANENGDDPLYDPLALDDDCPGGGGLTVEDINPHDVSTGSEADVDGVASGKIILVDVTTLTSNIMNQSDEVETDDDEDAVEQAAKEDLTTSDTEEPAELLTNNSSFSDEAGRTEETSQLVSDQSSECVVLEVVEDDGNAMESDGIQETLESSSVTENDSFTMAKEQPADGSDKDNALPKGHTSAPDTLVSVVLSPDVDQHQKDGASNKLPEQIQGALPSGAEAEEEEASDGSDSGLGLEPSRSVNAPSNSSSCSSSNSNSNSTSSSNSSTPLEPQPIKSSLKRRSEPPGTTGESSASSLGLDDGVSREKRPKKAITFEGVTVYYFPRIQGFGCVPSQGGCTLGMEFEHVHSRRLTLAEHSSEQRKVHRQQLQELNPRSSSSDDTSSEEEPSESGSEAESESYGFLQPVTTRQRRALLKAAGVRKIDSTEKDECREIRTSREVCGCTCRGFCDPATCACSLAGIKCQVDRPSFPCGCTQEGCGNKAGRVEFNPGRVRTHFIHTIMRLNLEGKASEMRRPLVGGNTGTVSNSVVDGGTSVGETGYVGGSEKNWSNGPIRLQQPGMVYAAGMLGVPTPGPSGLGVGTEGGGLVPMNHHSMSPSSYHQQPSIQTQHQYFGPPPDESYLASSAYHDYMGGNAQTMLLGAAPTSTSAINTTPQHLIGGLISPAHTTNPVDVHYGYRDYFGGSSSAPTTSEQPQQHLPHGQIYYNYAGGSSTGTNDGSSTLDPTYRHPPVPATTSLPPMHQIPGTGSISPYHAQQHTVPTGHDRQHLAGYSGDGVEDLPASASTDATPLPMSTVSSLDTPDGSQYASAEVPFPSSNRSFTSEAEQTISISDSSAEGNLLDSSVEEIGDGDEPTAASPSPVITVVDDEDDAGGKQSPRVSGVGNDEGEGESESTSCFIDLTAPVAGNAERLEAINDLLASSRRSASLAPRTIAAEDDDELRDFRHSPLPPMISIDSDDEDDVPKGADSDDGGDADVIAVDRPTTNSSDSSVLMEKSGPFVNGGETLAHRNGTETPTLINGGGVHRLGEERDKRPRETLLVRARASYKSNIATAPTTVAAAAAAAATAGLESKLAKTDTIGSPSSGPASPVPSENLSEIIKNSIVETAVTH